MKRPISKIAPEWWDFTTLDPELLSDAAKLKPTDLEQLSRPGFTVRIYETVQEFYAAAALEYIEAWKQSTPDNPAGICGPIGPTEQLPIVAQIVNALGMNLKDAHFWGMDEWVIDGKTVPEEHPLSFVRTVKNLCFDRIDEKLRIPASNMHFPSTESDDYSRSFDSIRCVLMQGGQGEVKHWAFNDPFKRQGEYLDAPPSPETFRKLKTRHVTLHPVTMTQNARTSGGGNIALVPTEAMTVGPYETWKTNTVSIWHPGHHDNPFGIRLTALMISKGLADSAVPMSLLADHPNVRFNYLRAGIGSVEVEMH